MKDRYEIILVHFPSNMSKVKKFHQLKERTQITHQKKEKKVLTENTNL